MNNLIRGDIVADYSKQQQEYVKLERILKELPWYIEEFIDYKRRRLSASSLLNYCHDHKIFFNWLITEGIYEGNIKDVPLESLEKLTVQQIEGFLSFLCYQLGNKEITVNRKLSALKSLFHYLQNIAENDNLTPYLQRNVMAKVEFNEINDNPETVANKMEGNILTGDDYENSGFLLPTVTVRIIKITKKFIIFICSIGKETLR